MPTTSTWRNEPDAEGYLPPCQFYVSPEQPEHGAPAEWAVLIKNKVSNATVHLCDMHKVEHERKIEALRRQYAARKRVSSKK